MNTQVWDQQAIKTLLDTTDWYGVDGIKSLIAHQIGAHMAPSKFESAQAYVDALTKSVDKYLLWLQRGAL